MARATCWTSRSPEETRRLAARLARAVAAEGALVSLVGALGSGKTVFAKGFAEALGVPPDLVSSPTFVIANEYETPWGGRLIHADLFRLSDPLELETAGGHEWFSPGNVVLVEWGDRLPEALPEDHLRVGFERHGTARRELRASAGGLQSRALLARWVAEPGEREASGDGVWR